MPLQSTRFWLSLAGAGLCLSACMQPTGPSGKMGEERMLSTALATVSYYEAENHTVSGATKITKTGVGDPLHGGLNTGTGYVKIAHTTADYIEWSVPAPTAQPVYVVFSYSNATGASVPMQLKVNGTTVNSALSFPTTTTSTSTYPILWRNVKAKVTFKSGTNKIRLTVAGKSGLYFDHLDVLSPPGAPVVSVSGQVDPANRPTWSWTGAGGSTTGNFRYKLDNSDLTTGATTTTGHSFTPALPMANGFHTLYVQETNSSGLWSLSGKASWSIALPVYQAVQQAEKALMAGPVIGSGSPGYVGYGYADFVNASTDYLEFSIPVVEDGVYNLTFRYALSGTSPRPLSVSVNGSVVNSSFAFPATGSWTTWQEVTLKAVMYSALDNKVRLTAIGSSGGNIDELRVTSPTLIPGPNFISGGGPNQTNSLHFVWASNSPDYGTGQYRYRFDTGAWVDWGVANDFLCGCSFAPGSSHVFELQELDTRGIYSASSTLGFSLAP